ncbi:1-acyl-sn-glycerol-3-phosphate acyltransferase [Rhizobiales bacterium GAS191]|nr:1-acyl-sn-glycerol-3-phosphate acyltransferase [Rhizobiales bacterium GAS113]SED68320.1 1-acyl-sn-glycerol-3-phosphate acyltransferase [Rhizobiales bacterium GAS191]SEE73606.1 1-acyl-sn-glycerol-3-phosphate acyltransferase [Rhizobiales bacterium GAS188]
MDVTSLPSSFERWTQRLVARFVGKVWYDTLLHGRIPERVPTIFVGLHRNGAIDGYVHLSALGGDILFLVAANLRRNPLTRLLAVGISVERAKDKRDRSNNPAAIDAAAHWVAAGGRLFVYPEGTSTLGPDVLPFHIGAARIVDRTLELGLIPKVVPVGIDYARPDMPGSLVDVSIGDIVDLDGIPDARSDRIAEIQRRITSSLFTLSYRFPDAATQDAVRYAAEIAAAGDRLKRLDLLRRAPPAVLPMRPRGSAFAMIAFGTGFVANLPLAIAIVLMPKLLADDRNVVALWQIVPTVLVAPVWLLLSGAVGLAVFGLLGLSIPVAQMLLGATALRAAAHAWPPVPPSGR